MGYEIVPTWRKEHLLFSKTLASLFESKQINCVLDVGGNKGQYRDFLRHHVDYQGLIITFEPTEKNFQICSKRAKNDDKWIVYNFALGSKDEQKEIKIMKSDAFSSFLSPSTEHISDFASNNIVESIESVDVRKLDTIWDELNINNFNIYLKMDTQGYDLEVFNGSLQHINRILALQTEASVIGIYDGMCSIFDHIKFMNDYGFDIAGMFPVSMDTKGRVIEFDVVMINRAF